MSDATPTEDQEWPLVDATVQITSPLYVNIDIGVLLERGWSTKEIYEFVANMRDLFR